MVLTIEPGYYAEGRFGVRIENCYEVVRVPAKNLASGADNFLTFVPLTLVPIQKSLIVRELLQQKHVGDLCRKFIKFCVSLVNLSEIYELLKIVTCL